MAGQFIDCGGGFWSVRGSYRVGGVVNVGTQCSLIRIGSGEFIFLDSYTLTDAVRREVDRLTDGGAKVAAIVNLHPFHTVHCEWMHRAFPQAKLYGTARHHAKFPDLPWQSQQCEDDAFPAIFGDDLRFSVPAGTQMVCADENVHFSSILAYHPVSGSLHVDDTLTRLKLPFPLALLPMEGRLDFHPTLAKSLKPEAGAADAFREWAIALGMEWHEARRVVAAHNSILEMYVGEFPQLIGEALGRVKPVLDAHRAEFG
ncbi:hypothetical protein [Qipengyuania marisflavi]|uniref:MBL fold metallo-hydrolase n=1 Tax=Qipengyuania marisflavi TaxID=2486356 RepID=A0A5S3PA97_9SPHN|nr:hypothetical protein [Qipengyuania marisflavi]TMM50283.1 hypothetical protein FEV51_03645 [Qipengyuania marisflavi]